MVINMEKNFEYYIKQINEAVADPDGFIPAKIANNPDDSKELKKMYQDTNEVLHHDLSQVIMLAKRVNNKIERAPELMKIC